MKKFNFKKFVFGISFLALTSGFILSYFSEPTREEKVLRALNYDLRFTEKVASQETKRKPTSESPAMTLTPKSSLTFGKNSEGDHVFAKRLYELLANTPKSSLDEKWELVSDVVVIKNPDHSDQNDAFEAFRGHYFFRANHQITKNYRPNQVYKLVLNKKTKMIGFLTGSITIKLKPGENAQEFWQGYDVTLDSYFENSQILIVTPNSPDELMNIFYSMKDDLSAEKVELEILYRFVEKR